MKAKPADGDDYTYIYPQRTEGVQVAKAPPVTPYAEPTIAPNIAQPWPQRAEVQLSTLTARCDAFHGRLAAVEQWLDDNEELFADLRQQIADLRSSNSALIEAMLKTDGDDDDVDF